MMKDLHDYWNRGPKHTGWNAYALDIVLWKYEEEEDFLPLEFEAEARGYVTEYHPAQISGPVEACYPAEGGVCEDFMVRILAGPSTTARMNWVYLTDDDFGIFFGDFQPDADDIREILEHEAE